MHPPPDGRTELANTPEGLAQWGAFLSTCIANAVRQLGLPAGGTPQFVEALPDGAAPAVPVPVFWNAFPRKLLSLYGRARALMLADRLWPEHLLMRTDPECEPGLVGCDRRDDRRRARAQDEYCEWRVERDQGSGRIRRVVFTCETEAYWQAVFGGRAKSIVGSVPFHGDPALAARRFGELVGSAVAPVALTAHDGGYDPLNRWNTTHGIVHMGHPRNGLDMAIKLCADATRIFRGADGALLTSPEAVACAGGQADTGRASDLTITGAVNALARQGAQLALADPAGIVIHDIDTRGWRWPDGEDATPAVTREPALPAPTLRLVVEAPADSGFLLDDLTIGNEPLLHGGQIAECITVGVTLLARFGPGVPEHNTMKALAQGFVRDADLRLLRTKHLEEHWLRGERPAFGARRHP